MNRVTAIALKDKAFEVAKNFSNLDREKNFNKEIFVLESIVPLSESTALAFYIKKPSEKRAMAFFYVVKHGKGSYWEYFFATDSHVLGMGKVEKYLQEVEAGNYKLNFESVPNYEVEKPEPKKDVC